MLKYFINFFKSRINFFFVLDFLFILLSVSCTFEKNNPVQISNITKKFRLTNIKYAKGFEIKYYEGYKIVSVSIIKNLNNSVIHKYYLVDKNLQIPENLKNIKVIRTPVQRIICLSTTHIAFVDLIGKAQTIKGISVSKLVNNEKICKLINSEKIVDVGYDNDLNYELILSLKPDLIIAYNTPGESDSNINKLEEFGINVVINAEYLEETPLAKSEWVKFIAAFYNEEELANSKFDKIEKDYNYLKGLIDASKKRPLVITGLPWKNIWYLPGGKTSISNLIYDAGGDYIYKNNTSSIIFPSNIEFVFENFHNADIWVNCGTANSLNEIKLNDERLQHFKSFKESKIYNNNAKLNASGGNDYWESGLVNPQIILKDLISILHPEILPDYKMFYYKKLK